MMECWQQEYLQILGFLNIDNCILILPSTPSKKAECATWMPNYCFLLEGGKLLLGLLCDNNPSLPATVMGNEANLYLSLHTQIPHRGETKQVVESSAVCPGKQF